MKFGILLLGLFLFTISRYADAQPPGRLSWTCITEPLDSPRRHYYNGNCPKSCGACPHCGNGLTRNVDMYSRHQNYIAVYCKTPRPYDTIVTTGTNATKCPVMVIRRDLILASVFIEKNKPGQVYQQIRCRLPDDSVCYGSMYIKSREQNRKEILLRAERNITQPFYIRRKIMPTAKPIVEAAPIETDIPDEFLSDSEEDPFYEEDPFGENGAETETTESTPEI